MGPARPATLADSDPQTLRCARAVLSDSGYAPVVTGETERLSRIIRSESPAVVLLDLMLSGTELMRQVPEREDIVEPFRIPATSSHRGAGLGCEG